MTAGGVGIVRAMDLEDIREDIRMPQVKQHMTLFVHRSLIVFELLSFQGGGGPN
jgi:hypothetical protein